MKYFWLIFIFIVQCSIGQNLVPNHSFEEFRKCPSDFTAESSKFYVNDWSIPTKGTTDFLHSCSKKVSIPQNRMGYQTPKEGMGYIGVSYLKNWYEYIQCQLAEPLKKGTTYYLEFWVSLSDNSRLSLSDIGGYLSNEKIGHDSYKRLIANPQIFSNTQIIDTINWVKISGKFIAQGGENFFTLGCFGDNKSFKKTGVKKYPKEKGAYYYIDDVCVVPISDSSECKCEQKEITVQIPDTTKKTFIQEQKIEIGEKFIIENIYFETAKSDILPPSYSELDKLSELFNKYQQLVGEISGHTDSTGKEEENQKLSEARAKEVVEYLISKGIKKERLQFKGYGSNMPISTNETEEGRQENRRVEFKVLKK